MSMTRFNIALAKSHSRHIVVGTNIIINLKIISNLPAAINLILINRKHRSSQILIT